MTYEERFDQAKACLSQLRKRASVVRAEANKWVGDGESPNGVSYEILDSYARGMEDAIAIMAQMERV